MFRYCVNFFKNYNASRLFSTCTLWNWTSTSWSQFHNPPSGCIFEPQRSLCMSPLQESESHGGSGVLHLVHCHIICSWSKRRSPINIWCIFPLTKKKKSRSVSFRNMATYHPHSTDSEPHLQLPRHHWPRSVELFNELLHKYKKFSPHLDFIFQNCLNYDFCCITTLGILWFLISTLPHCAYAHMSW